MYTIGQISKLVNVSKDTLRYYDTINLLKPASIKENGYRYYSEEQVKEMLCIIELKACGFNLDAIKSLMSCQDPKELTDAYDSKLKELDVDLKALEKTIDFLKHKLHHTGEGSKSIVLVDDSDFMRMMQKDILNKNGHLVIAEASNGHLGLEMIRKHSLDLVITNIDMPEMDGLEMLKALKDKDDLEIIVCSSQSSLYHVLTAFSLQAKHYLKKPFNGSLDFIDCVNGVNLDTSNQALELLNTLNKDELNILLQQDEIYKLREHLFNSPLDTITAFINAL